MEHVRISISTVTIEWIEIFNWAGYKVVKYDVATPSNDKYFIVMPLVQCVRYDPCENRINRLAQIKYKMPYKTYKVVIQ